MARLRSQKTLPRPHKRPSQDRSRFTVQALYDAFVRIWRREGPQAVTMRAVAKEAGYAIGTLYEYFPNREAMLSGYFRHCLDELCRRIAEADSRAVDASPASHPWRARLRALVGATLDERGMAPYFDADMLLLESSIADADQHKRAFDGLCDAFGAVLCRWPDLPALERDELEALVVVLWGARRYAILLGRDQSGAAEVDRITAMLEAALAGSDRS